MTKKIPLFEKQKRYVVDFELVEREIIGSEIEITNTSYGSTVGSSVVLGKKELGHQMGQSLTDVLREVPGLAVVQTGGGISKPVIRGFSGSQIAIYSDNVRQESQDWGIEHAPPVDPFGLDRIEVIKGIGAIEYGGNVLGGIIKPSVSLEQKGGLELFGSRLGWIAQVSSRIAGDAFAPNYMLANTAFREINFFLGFGIKNEKYEVGVKVGRYAKELGLHLDMRINNVSALQNVLNGVQIRREKKSPYYDVAIPKQKLSHLASSLNIQFDLEHVGKFETIYGLQVNDRMEFDEYFGFRLATELDPPADYLNLQTHSITSSLSLLPIDLKNFDAQLVSKGGCVFNYQINTNAGTASLIPNYTSFGSAVYWEESLLTKYFNIDLAARYDIKIINASAYRNLVLEKKFSDNSELKNRTRLHLITLLLGFNFQINEEHSISTNISYSNRNPTVHEWFSDGIHHGSGQYEKGNEFLLDEKNLGTEITYRVDNNEVRGEVSLFLNFVTDYIHLELLSSPAVTISGVFPAWAYKQDNAVLFGVDAFFEVHILEPWKVTAKMSAVFGVLQKDFTSISMLPSPKATMNTQIKLPNFEILNNNFFEIGIDIVLKQYFVPRVEGRLNSLILNSAEFEKYVAKLSNSPDGYATLHFHYGTEIHIDNFSISVRISVEDVLNLPYRDYLSRFRIFSDNSGRNVTLRINVPLNF
ncbi:hypothetical protein CHS0354_000813 [Potamilus streckersoni]|uniref:TonB-dependent receptor n=1 Tax=Potamilus streckersoni TaxID=2493646 RepID=A0AAE0W8L9_9BIVA|nr:hypothetical protein CHS0354_000813 [Potamilus streckersoni]